MKKIFVFIAATVAAISFTACNDKKTANNADSSDSLATVADTAIYGVVGEGTSMHSLEILDSDGKTTEYVYGLDTVPEIQGGAFPGDRLTFLTKQTEDGLAVMKGLNLTTLKGKWTALDRNFEIKDDGVVESPSSVETNPYTKWATCNCKLILNTDTFDVLLLGPDSLTLENGNGIFVYKRQK